eukprot:3353524-Prymnesium_polylepis.1
MGRAVGTYDGDVCVAGARGARVARRAGLAGGRRTLRAHPRCACGGPGPAARTRASRRLFASTSPPPPPTERRRPRSCRRLRGARGSRRSTDVSTGGASPWGHVA